MLTLLFLGTDSLIVGAAIGPLIRSNRRLALAAWFGVADGLGFLIGWSLHLHVPDLADGLVCSLFVAADGLYILVVAANMRRRLAGWPVWLLPIAMSFDNFSAGLTRIAGVRQVSVQVGEQILSSGALALLGLTIGATLTARLPVRARIGTAGGLTILAAALLVAS
jgi:hypothetical protein